MAGRLAPFIELGVGFNPELTSRENVVLNGVMMGLGRREARQAARRGARLRRAARVRRAQAQELLVRDDGPARVRGDGRGGRRHHADRRGARGRRRRRSRRSAWTCSARSGARARRSCSSRTTWRPSRASATGRCCIHDGEQRYLGDPEEAALRYFRLNFPGRGRARPDGRSGVPDVNVRVVDAWLENEPGSGSRTSSRASRSACAWCSRRGRSSTRPVFGIHFLTRTAITVFGFNRTLDVGAGERSRRPASGCGSPARSRTRSCRAATSSTASSRATGPRATSRCTCVAAARLRRLRNPARGRAA